MICRTSTLWKTWWRICETRRKRSRENALWFWKVCRVLEKRLMHLWLSDKAMKYFRKYSICRLQDSMNNSGFWRKKSKLRRWSTFLENEWIKNNIVLALWQKNRVRRIRYQLSRCNNCCHSSKLRNSTGVSNSQVEWR